MKSLIRYGVMLLTCGVLLAGPVRADENDASVIDGPSRGELFEARMKAEYGPNILSAAAARPFDIPGDVLGDAVYGIAVSHHNDENCRCKAGQKCDLCKINWNRISSQKVGFVYVKSTQGTRFRDPTFDYHWRALAQQKISRGASHFMAADEDPVEQADFFVDKLEASGKLTPADMPPCLDLEADLRRDAAKKWIVVAETGEKLDFWKGQEPDEIMGKILKWLKRVEERTGRVPIIYTSRGWWRDRVKDDKKFAVLKRYPIWIANYPESGRPTTESPKVPNDQAWTLWQFTDSGRMSSTDVLPGNMDVNVYKGTLVNFRRALGMSAPEPLDIARAQEAKETSQPPQQVASLGPTQASDANTQSAQKASNSNPIPPADVNKQAPQATPANPVQPVEATKPAQPAPAVQPAPPAQAVQPAPSAPVATQTLPIQPAPAQIVQPAPPAQAVQSAPPAPAANPRPPVPSKPAEQAASTTPSPPTDASKLTPQAAETLPQSPATSKSTDQTASINAIQQKTPASSSGQAAAPNSVTASAPAADAAKAAPPRSPRTPAPAQRVAAAAEKTPVETAAVDKAATDRIAQKTATETATPAKTAADKAAADKTPGERQTIEIELPNGRKLRFDANIDPALLARLIAAIDK